MLQNISDKLKRHRVLGLAVLIPIALIFAVWGAYGVVNTGFGSADYGMKVNGERISTDTLNRAWQERQAQYEQALKGADLSDAQKKIMQAQLLDEYVRQTVMRQRADEAGYRASDEQVYQAMQSEPAFQLDGKFDPRVARNMLAQAGLTEDSYFAERRQAIEIQQLQEGVELSDFLTPSEIDRIYALQNEQRELRYAVLPADKYLAAVKIDDAKVKAWYDAHASDYLNPESVQLQYAELSLDAIAAGVTVSPQDLQAFYDKNKSRYSEVERRHAHHILITVAEPKDAKADAAALAKANDVLAQLKAGKDFGELAKKYSGDPGSANQGGDLGVADKSAYVAPFADALFALKPGQVSDPIKTQYGYHIIKLDEIQPAHVKTLDDAHAEIEADYRRDEASELFGDRQEQLQQKLESSQSTDLEALAKQFELKTGEVSDFTHTTGGAPLGNSPELLAAVFNDDVVSGHKLGGPVALGEENVVVFKVLAHHPAAPKSLESVRDQVIAAIRKNDSTQAAKAAAEDAVKRLDGGASYDEVVKGLGVTATPAAFVTRNDPQLPAQVREVAFAAPKPDGKPVYRALALDNGGAALVDVSAVKAGTAGSNSQADQQLLTEFQRRDREGDMSAYVMELQRRASVKRNPTVFD